MQATVIGGGGGLRDVGLGREVERVEGHPEAAVPWRDLGRGCAAGSCAALVGEGRHRYEEEGENEGSRCGGGQVSTFV